MDYPSPLRADTPTKWFQYGMKRGTFPFGRRAGFQQGFRYRAAASGSVRSGLSQADNRLEL
jgi:hypothetical protein